MSRAKPEPTGGSLTEEQRALFRRDGFVTIPGFLTEEECAEMRARATELVDGFDASEHRTVFSTSDGQKHKSEKYFLDSAGNVSFFFEEGAFNKDGDMVVDKSVSINKIGHAMHDLDPVFKKYSYDERVRGVLQSLFHAPSIVQSMYIFKQPRIGGEVSPHQDGAFLITKPQSVVGLWWALEDCTLENGCLWAVPGSQELGVERVLLRNEEGTGTSFHPAEEEPFDLTDAVPLVVPAGTLVLLHSALVHFSAHNTSDASRHAYSVHVVETEGAEYSARNWLQRPADMPFTVLSWDHDDAATSDGASGGGGGGGGAAGDGVTA